MTSATCVTGVSGVTHRGRAVITSRTFVAISHLLCKGRLARRSDRLVLVVAATGSVVLGIRAVVVLAIALIVWNLSA
jgi:hypothetical protein